MIKKIKNIQNNISKKHILILGAGISGIGAAKLAKFLNASVYVSDIDKNSKNKKILIKEKIPFELGEHSEKCIKTDLVIISPGINPKNEFIAKIKSKNIPIVSEIEFASWFTKSPIIGITGSNGKSTVVKLVNNIFLNKYKNSLIGGNIGISFSENVLKEKTNELNNVIHILEISSFQLENIYLFTPHLCCLLNITEDHLDRYIDENDYFNTKIKISKNIKNSANIIFNYDDKKLNNLFTKIKNTTPFSIMNKISKLKIKGNKIFSKNNDLIVNQSQTKLIGKHNFYNIVASIIIAKKFKISNQIISKSLTNFTPLEHRMEKVNINSKITFINDSKGTNIFSTISAIESFKNDIILILGGYSNEKINKSRILKSLNKDKIKNIICYGNVGPILKSLVKDIKPTLYYKAFEKAILNSIKIAKEGDVVLLSPAFKSFDQFKSFEERGNKFKEIVKNYYA